MCGRYSLDDIDHVGERFAVADIDLAGLRPRYNIAPTQVLPVIVREGSGNTMVLMRWGLIPQFTRAGEPKRYNSINARAETLTAKPSFKNLLVAQRCLVPATGFFEWKTEGKEKQPYYFRLWRERLFAFAGLYDLWQDEDQKEVYSYTIITIQPNNVVGPVHNRMPVILQKEDESTWLHPDIVEPERLLPLLRPYADADMESYPVSRLVNSPGNDKEDVLKGISN